MGAILEGDAVGYSLSFFPVYIHQRDPVPVLAKMLDYTGANPLGRASNYRCWSGTFNRSTLCHVFRAHLHLHPQEDGSSVEPDRDTGSFQHLAHGILCSSCKPHYGGR
jgi:hypothetical protein